MITRLPKLLFIMTAASALTANAEILTPDQALDRAMTARPAPMKAKGQTPKRLEMTVTTTGQPACYIFSSPNGYMVVAANDVAPAVLGYSDSGTFDATMIPPQMRYWLDEYAEEIEYAMTMGGRPAAAATATDDKAPIAPMTTTRWNQDAPFNNLCPMDNGARSVTGCVATALAQIMKYHNYPAKGKGQNSYTCNGQTLTLDFGDTTYDWDNMVDVYTTDAAKAENDAVATLMYSCGVAVNMQYTSDESSATSIAVPSAMVEYFGYDRGIRYYSRNFYGLREWQDIVYDQLKNYGPVQYSGEGSDGGHSFVCDGYSSDGYFHINWGWGGMSDGYFLLTALDPETQGIGGATSGFNYQQDIIGNVSTPRDGSVMYEQLAAEGSFAIGTASTTLGGTVKVNSPVYNLSIGDVSGRLGLKFTSSTGAVTYADGSKYTDMEALSGVDAFTATVPTDLASGSYVVTPVYCNSHGEWMDVLIPISEVRSAVASVDGDNVTFTAGDNPTLALTEVQTDITPYYIGSNFEIKANVANNQNREYYGAIVAAIVDGNGDLVAYGDDYPVDLMPGESLEMDYISAFSNVPYGNQTETGEEAEQLLQAGEYTLFLVSADLSTAMSEGYVINLQQASEETQIAVSGLALADGGNLVTDKAHLKATAQVECESGYFGSTLTLAIFDYSASNEESIAAFSSDPVFVESGNSATVTFEGDFSAATNGGRYMALVYNGQNQVSEQPLVFTVSDTNSISDATVDNHAIYYNVMGMSVSPDAPGLFIKATAGKTEKILVR